MRRLAVLGAGWAALSCSFVTATGFEECKTDTDCDGEGAADPLAGTKACIERFCLPLATGCRRQAGEFKADSKVAFAAVLPLSSVPDGGVIDQSEQQGLNALSLAVSEGNARDGIKGRKFALLFCNTGNDDALAKQQVEWLATQLKLPAVLTSGSGQTIAVTNVAAARDVLVMSATSTSPELIGTFQANKGLVWRTAPSDSLQARVMADLIEKDYLAAPAVKIGILYVNTTYGQGLSAALRTRLPAKFTVKESFFESGGDITQAVNDLNAFGPQLTLVVGFPPDIRAIINRAASTPPLDGGTTPSLSRDAGHRWLFSDSAKDLAVLGDGALPQLVGAIGTAPAQGAGATFGSFRDRFITSFKADPSNYSFTSHSYDAMYLLMLSAAWATNNNGAISGPRMADGLRSISAGAPYRLEPAGFTGAVTAMQAHTPIDVEGASGKLAFDPDAGAPSAPYELWQVEADGGFSTTCCVEPSGP